MIEASERTKEIEKRLTASRKVDELRAWAQREINKYTDDQRRAIYDVIHIYYHGDGEGCG